MTINPRLCFESSSYKVDALIFIVNISSNGEFLEAVAVVPAVSISAVYTVRPHDVLVMVVVVVAKGSPQHRGLE